MASTVSTKRPTKAARRTGYVIAALVNAGLLYLVNVWPGWDILPFLTGDFTEVLGWANASMIAGIVVNLVYVLRDAAWVRALGDIVTMSIGIAGLIAMWQVFPFDFADASFDWALLFRWVLGVGIVGSAIGIVVNLVSLVSDTRSRP